MLQAVERYEPLRENVDDRTMLIERKLHNLGDTHGRRRAVEHGAAIVLHPQSPNAVHKRGRMQHSHSLPVQLAFREVNVHLLTEHPHLLLSQRSRVGAAAAHARRPLLVAEGRS